MNPRRFLAALTAVIALGLFLFWFSGPTPREAAREFEVAPARSEPEAVSSSSDHVRHAGAVELAQASQVQARTSAEEADAAPSRGPRCQVFGRVVDEDGRALAGVEVGMNAVGGAWSDQERLSSAHPAGQTHESLRTRTEGDGRFRFEAPLPTADWITLSVTPSEHYALAGLHFGPAGGRDRPRISAGDNDVGEIALVRRGAIEGRVLSMDGSPIPNVNLSTLADREEGRRSNARTDASGRFLLGHVPAGQAKVDVRAEGWVPASQVQVDVSNGETTSIADIVLTRAAEIGGTVVDEQGSPIARIRVQGSPVAGGQSASARTRDDGTFTLYLAKPDPHTLEVKRAEGFLDWGGGRGAPEFTFEPGRQDLRIVLTRAATTTFRVVEAESRAPIESFGISVATKPAPGSITSLFARDLRVEAHPRGEVALPASPGVHLVCVSAPDRAPAQVDVAHDAGQPGVQTIALAQAAALRGRLLLAGEPLVRATARLERESLQPDGTPTKEAALGGTHVQFDVGEHAGRRRSVAPDETGRFRFGELSGGHYRLRIEGGGGARTIRRGLEVPAQGELDLGDLHIDPGARVRGRLVAAAGESAVGYKVRLDGDWDRELVVALASGEFEFEGLEAGQHFLEWMRPGQEDLSLGQTRTNSEEFELAAGEAREIVIHLADHAPCTLNVLVVRSGSPVPGVTVLVEVPLRNGSGRFYESQSTTDGNGRVTLSVDGGTRFDLTVRTASGQLLGSGGLDLVAPSGGFLEKTIEIRLGTLTLELPPSLAAPQTGWTLRAVLSRANQDPCFGYASSPGSRGTPPNAKPWTGPLVELGEFPAGTFDATIHFERVEPDPATPNRWKRTPLREPHTTSVTIPNGGAARIVVP
ncbi:MAG: carboxypeptidase regulatory-like domain-containing protein [Planctomycetes bacterium]|nr:carboxypeptidase regulatory-like domain-containing protein [Planctomycetota bacterium]